MKRVAINNGTWFDMDKAAKFEENSYHDGSNYISKATGSQWDHQNIFLTTGGTFILNSWSNYQGKPETYEIISNEEAAEWFVKNEFQDAEIPEVLKEFVANLEQQ